MLERILPQSFSRKLTMRYISRRLDLSLVTLYNWRRHPEIPLPVQTETVGKQERIYVDELDFVEWLERFRPNLAKEWSDHEHEFKAAA